MDKFIFQEFGPGNRAQMIRDNSDVILSDYSYFKDLSNEEIEEFKEELSEKSIKLDDLQVALKEIRQSYKDQMKPFAERIRMLVKNLREKGSMCKEECYGIKDFAEGMYGIYNADGELISERKLTPGERQKSMYSELREGTNG